MTAHTHTHTLSAARAGKELQLPSRPVCLRVCPCVLVHALLGPEDNWLSLALYHIGFHLLHRELVELPGSSVLSHKHPTHRAGAHYSAFITFMLHSVSRLKAAAYHHCPGHRAG